MHLRLRLSKKEQQHLFELAALFKRELEDFSSLPFPRASSLSTLREELKTVLFRQRGFESLWKRSQTQTKILTLSHKQTDVRNLPWQVATEERPLLTIAKSFRKALVIHEPSLGYPLKVLVMVASPEGVSRLAYEEEELQLLRAFSPLMSKGLVQVHFTDDGSMENLEEKLEENKYHILHFTGHGSYQDGQGMLALEDPLTGQLQQTPAKTFNELMAKVAQKGHRPDLIVLSACQSAQGVAAGDLSGVADTLMQGGVPAVIAMSASILDKSAAIFASTLYGELSNGYRLRAAFQAARFAIRQFELQFDLAAEGRSPGQWLIPQLLLSEAVDKLVDESAPKTALDFQHDVKIITGKKALVDLRVRPKNYVFIGRRREKGQALRQLKEGRSVLLRGQGGVGKTALAEHLAIRLLAADQRIKVFTCSEKTPNAQSLLHQIQNYLTREKKDFKIVSELALISKQTDQFFHLLGRVSEHCQPIFLFDNVESFQQFDQEQSTWLWHKDKHEDLFQFMEILLRSTSFPLIVTGRYPITEFPELNDIDMNTVSFSDFLRKCHQLSLSSMAQKMQSAPQRSGSLKKAGDGRPLTFEDIVQLLYKTFGGNYRALEFFDELYRQKGDDIFQTLSRLTDFEAQLEQEAIKQGVLTRMSENLIFEELMTHLNDEDRDSLNVLAQFNVPVFPMAVAMQRKNEDRTESLQKALELTLVERQSDIHGQVRYYVVPIVRDLLKINQATDIEFDQKVAGDYHTYVWDNDLEEDWIVELSEAFERYAVSETIDALNITGGRLCRFYYDLQQFRLSLQYGIRVESIARERTAGYIWNILGLIFQLYGDLDRALAHYQRSLKDDRDRGDKKGEGATLNNISQIYHAKGDYDTTLHFLQHALKIRQDIGDKKGEGTTLNNISQIYHVKGDYDTALHFLQQALKIQQDIGNKLGEGTVLNNISQIYDATGDYDTALHFLQQALKIQQDVGDNKGEASTLNNLATTAHATGDYDTALHFLQQALKIQQDVGDKKGEGTTLNNISLIYDTKGDYDTALHFLQQALEIRRHIGDRNGTAVTFYNLGSLFYEHGDAERAVTYLVQAYLIFDQIGSPDKEMPEKYMSAIIAQIGEDRFGEIAEKITEQGRLSDTAQVFAPPTDPSETSESIAPKAKSTKHQSDSRRSPNSWLVS